MWYYDNGDGISECYYFDTRGVLLKAGITPDGYIVNSDGAWTVNNIVQTRTETQNIFGNILATENQQSIINDVIEVKAGVYYHKT